MAKSLTETSAEFGPKSMEIDGEKIEQFGPDDLKKIRDDENAKQAAKVPGFGLRFQQIIPPGTG